MRHLFLFIFLLCPFIVYGQESPPQVAIVQPLNGTVFEGEQVRVDYVISGTALNFVRVFLDDRPVQLLNDAVIGQNAVVVDVPGRDCKISIIAQNEFGASFPAVVNLKWNEHIFKPKLYILAIGVSKYDDRNLRLHFAAKDALDFSLSMFRQEELLYEKVELMLLTDEDATSQNIRDGLQWLQTETTFGDVAMLFLAGHGINNNIGDFYFMPVGADINRINASCVPYTEIKGTIDAIAGKMLVFIDACHSGNVLGNNQQRAAMLSDAISDLTNAENGAVVFTSSTGRQFSLENPEWNNGAFTKALVEGLEGEADLFRRQIITVNTLSSYVANRVKDLTNGQQAPTIIIPNSVPDFPLAVVSDLVAQERPDIATINRFTSTTRKKSRSGQFHMAVSAGTGGFGTVSRGDMVNKGTTVFGADVAYFFNSNSGAGIKANMTNSDVDFGEDGSWNDRVMFIGAGFYGRWAKNRLELTAGAAVGSLRWDMTNVKSDEIAAGQNQSASSTGAFLWTGVNYMLSGNIGVGLNVQSAFGTVKAGNGMERNPAGVSVAAGISFRF